MLLSLLVLQSVHVTEVVGCPEYCDCRRDGSGRKHVSCSKGGINTTLPIEDIDPSVEVLRITAPRRNENNLTLAPIFHGFHELREVHITRSNLRGIGKHSFWGVPTLLILNLTDNNITQIVDHNFRGLINLSQLYLDNNAIEKAGPGPFHYLTDLRILSLKRNRLKFLPPRFFWKLGKLLFLDLSYNPLADLESQVFQDVQDLRSFSCRCCSLSTMNPHMYSLLPNLSSLDLGENRFHYLDRDAFLELRNLLVLKLDGNHFPVVMDGTFQSQVKLEHLDLSRSYIAKVTTQAFENLFSLVELDLSYNKLESLEPRCMEASGGTLNVLNISGNNIRIEEFSSVLQVTPKLRSLSIADVGMKNGIPVSLLYSITSLKQLNISGNKLKRFPAELLSPVPSLSHLDLSRNRLEAIDERSMSRLSYVQSVNLSGNPFVCNICHVISMLDESFNASWLSSAICVAPAKYFGRPVSTLKLNQLAPCNAGIGVRNSFDFPERAWKLLLVMGTSTTAFIVIIIATVVAGVLHSQRNSRNMLPKENRNERPKEGKMAVSVIDGFTKPYEAIDVS